MEPNITPTLWRGSRLLQAAVRIGECCPPVQRDEVFRLRTQGLRGGARLRVNTDLGNGSSSEESTLTRRADPNLFRHRHWSLRDKGTDHLGRSSFIAWKRYTEEKWIDEVGSKANITPGWVLDLKQIFGRWKEAMWKNKRGPEKISEELRRRRFQEFEAIRGVWPNYKTEIDSIEGNLEEMEAWPTCKRRRGGTLKRRANRLYKQSNKGKSGRIEAKGPW